MDQKFKLSHRRILVVEDEFFIAEELQCLLQDAGMTVVGPVGNLTQALTVAQNSEFELALLDVNLSGHYVYPLAAKLEERNILFIFMIGYGRAGLPPECAARPCLAKLFNVKSLLSLIETTMFPTSSASA
ncbi:MAG: response regulator [Gammaproteobacteria bacterium]